MARLSVLSFRASLTASLPAAAGAGTVLAVDAPIEVARLGEVLNGDVIKECLSDATNTTVLTITHPAGTEAIEVASVNGLLRIVERGLQGTQIQQHPVGACVAFSGLPDSPCDHAMAFCSSDKALVTLADCLAPSLIERFEEDKELLKLVITQLCEVPEIQAQLARCVTDDIGEQLLNENILLQRLLEEMLKWMTQEDKDKLAGEIMPALILALCSDPGQRLVLAGCISDDILNRISGDPALLVKLRALINTGMSANAIFVTICQDPVTVQNLANCLTGAILNTFGANNALLVAFRTMLVSVVTGSGLGVTADGRITFTYSPGAIVSAICNSASDRTALAACLRPSLNIPPAANGAPIQISWQCASSGPIGISGPPPTIFVRIPDAGAGSGNISTLECYGINGYPNLSYQASSIQQFADGSKFVTFNSGQYIPHSMAGVGMYVVTANGITYTGILRTESCATVFDGGGG